MSVLTRNPWLKNLIVVLVTVLNLDTVTFRSTPADARVFVGVGIPFPGWGYYVPAPYYPYYGYPAYGYPGGFFIGGTSGPRFHHHYHHWR
jgi:hypothetical protein